MKGGVVRLGITLGDPRGIGPEIVSKALEDERVRELRVRWHIIGADGTALGVSQSVGHWESCGREQEDFRLAGKLAGLAVEVAARMALAGELEGIVTAPLDKGALRAGGFDYPGHTEMLGKLAGVHTTMMLASDRLRVVLATTHMALREVPARLNAQVLREAIKDTLAGLRVEFGIASPRVALCALNPHAGDHGSFGDEDDVLLAPVAREMGISGPYPADTVFVRAMHGEFDAVVAPYHDVGMTAIKVASFGHAVNVTLGLPFVRTSPDHGTALDIAGRGLASAESMVQAMLLAERLSARRRQAKLTG